MKHVINISVELYYVVTGLFFGHLKKLKEKTEAIKKTNAIF